MGGYSLPIFIDNLFKKLKRFLTNRRRALRIRQLGNDDYDRKN